MPLLLDCRCSLALQIAFRIMRTSGALVLSLPRKMVNDCNLPSPLVSFSCHDSRGGVCCVCGDLVRCHVCVHVCGGLCCARMRAVSVFVGFGRSVCLLWPHSSSLCLYRVSFSVAPCFSLVFFVLTFCHNHKCSLFSCYGLLLHIRFFFLFFIFLVLYVESASLCCFSLCLPFVSSSVAFSFLFSPLSLSLSLSLLQPQQ